ncbi:MAG: 4Fe-4S binding protein [Paraglaciecola sp.]|nr:4Fe-4S binding protein [Paraglaciecola sp.]
MTHVVTENCNGCRYTECVSVCPVECFHFDEKMTYIDDAACIDCGGCIPACPVNAIFDTTNIPDNQRYWIEINHQKSKELPVLDNVLNPLPTAQANKQKWGL